MKRVWIECTYKKGYDHRENGERAVGNAIWSPLSSKSGSDIYKNMRLVSPGDVILHLIDNKLIVGSSLVVDKNVQIVDGIKGTKWDDPENYLWKLGYYKEFKFPLIVNDFLKDSNNMIVLDQIRETSEVFYTKNYQLRQGAYLTPVSKELLTLINSEFAEKHYEPRMPHISDNLLYSSHRDLEVIIDKNFEEISITNKGDNYKSAHDEGLREIINIFQNFDLDYINDKAINLRPAGDIDLVCLSNDTIIIGEYKKGRNIEQEIINFFGKKNKYLKYLSEEFEFTRGKFSNVLFLVIGELIDERKLSLIEKKLFENGTLDKDSYDFKGFNIIGNRVIHRSQVDHYNSLANDIHKDYAFKDFCKDFNIKPKVAKNLIVPAIKINISHNKSDMYNVYNFSCKASELLKFASVARRTPVKEELSSYQRLISPKRIKDIGENFITNEKGFFPNNIVLKLEQDKVKFEKKSFNDTIDFSGFDSEIGILSIKEDYNSAWVIDGQHRLFSFYKVDESNLQSINDVVNVAAIVGVPPEKEVEYFIDINDKSKSVPKDLIWDLTGKIDPLSNDGLISNIWKEMFSIDKRFSDRQLNPFYRKLTIPSFNDKGGRNFALFCSLLKYECIGGNITRETYTKIMGDKSIDNVANPFLGQNKETFSFNVANSIASFFYNLAKKIKPSTTKSIFGNNNTLAIIVLIADRYFRYHDKMNVINNDTFFDIFASFLDNLSDEEIKVYKMAGNAEDRRQIIGDIVYHIQVNYKDDFFSVVQSQLISDVHHLCETKFPEYVFKKIKKEFGVDFVAKCPNLKQVMTTYISKANRRGTKFESWENLNFYSDLIKNFILNNNALKLGESDGVSKFKSILNDNGTIDVWEHCFKDVFTNEKGRIGFRDRKDFENSILRIKEYYDGTRHTSKKSHQVKDNYNPFVRDTIKSDFNLLSKIIQLDSENIK